MTQTFQLLNMKNSNASIHIIVEGLVGEFSQHQFCAYESEYAQISTRKTIAHQHFLF